MLNKKKIYPANDSKNNSNREKCVNLSIISNGEKQCSKNQLSVLLKELTPKNNDDLYSLNCLHFLGTKNKLESHKKVCEKKFFCKFFDKHQKFNEAPFIIYTDPESIIERIDRCKNNPEKVSTTKVSKHILHRYL